MIEISYGLYGGKGFARLKGARLSRIAKETNIVRLTFLDPEDNYVQIDMNNDDFFRFKERINRRKDIEGWT
ncbi:MAG TPA: hypothetical protein DDW17_09865 [Deltaproteobacteria bacterium]|nr:hypothetical protein [Deltaproteobacteria bacterium]